MMESLWRRDGRGAFVVIVGPDGVGKTTVARTLIERFNGPTGYFHFRPPLRGPLPSAPPNRSGPSPGKGEPGGSALLGWLRLARNVARFWAGLRNDGRPCSPKRDAGGRRPVGIRVCGATTGVAVLWSRVDGAAGDSPHASAGSRCESHRPADRDPDTETGAFRGSH